ncbi:PPOX class F420-dependent oxidoreductase [Streptomyces sp. NPDC014894]|uniref:PPOX class F420-dependent oxidoreductase n=1 Tax=unclassified Streptomyces TaxID=2593676 RepID=UPI0036F9827B
MSSPLSDAKRQILDAPNFGVLATLLPDGSPQTSVVWLGLDGDEVVISSQQGRRKVTNIAADPRVSLTVYDRNDPGRYVELRGTASIEEDTGRRTAVLLAEKYEGPGAGDEYLNLPPQALRVVLRITPRRAIGFQVD